MSSSGDDDIDMLSECGSDCSCGCREDEKEMRSLKNDIYKLQMDRVEIFKAQDPETGHFDLALDVKGRKLYVHRFCLAAASSTFAAMISFRWSKNADTIKIENPLYSYDNIYQLVCLLYSGKCTITKENVFILVDAAEYFNVQLLKDRCMSFLVNMDVVLGDVEELYDFIEKYSLTRIKDVLFFYAHNNMKAIVDAEKFLSHKKSFIVYLSTIGKKCAEDEEVFFVGAVNWAENQAFTVQEEFADVELDLEKTMKEQLQSILSNTEYYLLKFKFVKEFILDKQFLFSSSELYNIISSCQREDAEEDECFQTLYEIAELEACGKLDSFTDIDLCRAVHEELASFLPKMKFHKMTVKFLNEFVVDRGFEFLFGKLHRYLLNHRKMKKEESFKAVYELAHKLVTKKQTTSPDPNFNLDDNIKKVLVNVLEKIDFVHMDLNFVADFVIENGFDFSLDRLLFCLKNHRNQKIEMVFKNMYYFAKRIVLKRQKTLCDANFVYRSAIRTELFDFLPEMDFHLMDVEFLMDFVVERRFTFSYVALHERLLNIEKFEIEKAFETIYKVAKRQVLKKQELFPDPEFRVIDEIKNLLKDVLPKIDFQKMNYDFLLNFVVERGIFLSPWNLQIYLQNVLKPLYSDQQKLFNAIFQLAKKQVHKKQELLTDGNFNYYDAIENELSAVRCSFDFSQMDPRFLIDLVVKKGLHFLSATMLRIYTTSCRKEYGNNEEEFFTAVYAMAEKVVIQKQKASNRRDFNIHDEINVELDHIRSCFNFVQMKLAFLMEYVAGKGLLPIKVMRDIFFKYRKEYGNEEKAFEAIYKLAAKEAEGELMASADENFDVGNAIKLSLFHTIPAVHFFEMSKEFLNEFVVKNGILTDEQVEHVFYTRVKVTHGTKFLTGVFEDLFGIMEGIPAKGYYCNPQQWNKLRFSQLKFPLPTIPRTISKMKGTDWYLCFEKDGTLAVKHYNQISRIDDYIIAEMKTKDSEFKFIAEKPACLTVSYNNV